MACKNHTVKPTKTKTRISKKRTGKVRVINYIYLSSVILCKNNMKRGWYIKTRMIYKYKIACF
jgi:hypothetical protein